MVLLEIFADDLVDGRFLAIGQLREGFVAFEIVSRGVLQYVQNCRRQTLVARCVFTKPGA